jgi:hypothetical protein
LEDLDPVYPVLVGLVRAHQVELADWVLVDWVLVDWGLVYLVLVGLVDYSEVLDWFRVGRYPGPSGFQYWE